jgi:hypothetical protein
MPKICEICNSTFPFRAIIDGIEKNLQSRKYCLVCSPWGLHNTKVLNKEINDNKKNMDVERKEKDKLRIKKIQRENKAIALKHKGGKCISCGYASNIAALEFHHRDKNTKSFAIGDFRKPVDEYFFKELDKCDLLCCNCHRLAHESEMPAYLTKESNPNYEKIKLYNKLYKYYENNFICFLCEKHCLKEEESGNTCVCSKCHSKRQVYYQRNKKQLLADIIGGKCFNCNIQNVFLLDFHHVKPEEKDFCIGWTKWSTINDSIINEVKKCILLCTNCHREEENDLKEMWLN